MWGCEGERDENNKTKQNKQIKINKNDVHGLDWEAQMTRGNGSENGERECKEEGVAVQSLARIFCGKNEEKYNKKKWNNSAVLPWILPLTYASNYKLSFFSLSLL